MRAVLPSLRPVLLLAALAAASLELSAMPPRSFAEALGSAQQALAAGNQVEVRSALGQALAFAPDHPLALLHLARAEALLGDDAAALATLQRLARQGGVRDLAGDEAFAALRELSAFRAAAETLAGNAEPRVASTVTRQFDDIDFIPEGIAHDPHAGRFFIGSLNRRGILQWRDGEPASAFHRFDAASDTRVLGLRVSADGGTLWAATLEVGETAPRHARGKGGRAALLAFDLLGDGPPTRYPAPDDGLPHLLNDIALGVDGTLFVSDSERAAVYRLRPDASALELLHADDPAFSYPNGLALLPDGLLYVAHVEGISRFDPAAAVPRRERLAMPDGVPGGGIDGLYACGSDLLAVQGRFGFQQITRFVLDPATAAVREAEALERRHPAHDAATTGVIVGDAFHYIANAQLRRLDDDWNVAADPEAVGPTILRLPLERRREQSPHTRTPACALIEATTPI
ncbi:hypothetical protein H0E84_08860 [Luteimonas sp. SJ-92]|uniref:Tetratricopeptide repeat protein n=1 Tax=Luteimonas salinisoli TaxID=2752307 RepID=A0A853JCC4_9GAMM|nr:hypothetical protein [Luteimonas salinisoli]NZA26495.1 hypothetical protein [Luteimonas salinisoli]